MMMPERPKNTVLIVVKSPTLCEHVFTKPDQSIFGLRALIGAKFGIKLDILVLVFAGKILIDVGTMDQHNIDEGSTVYVVQKKLSENDGKKTMASSQQKPGQYSFPSATLTRVNFLKSLIHTLWPQMETMMNEPNVLREILFNDPRMKHIMERHPSIRHHINNDAYIREMIQCILCPARLEELNRKRDMMLLRVESTPGGAAVLHSINSSLTESLDNDYLYRIHSSKKHRTASIIQLGKENRMPLPNPWTRSRKSRKQVPRFLRRLTRLNKILPFQIQFRECKSTQTDQMVEKTCDAGPNDNLTPKPLVHVILSISNVGSLQPETNPIIGKLMHCVSSGIAQVSGAIQQNTATDLKELIKNIPPATEKQKRIVNEFWQSLNNVKKSEDPIGMQTYCEISTGYEETTKITKPNGEDVLVTKRTQGTNTDTLPLIGPSFRIIPIPKHLLSGLTLVPIQPQLQSIVPDPVAAGDNANLNVDDNSDDSADADDGKHELPPEIRYRDQLDHLASLGFNNRNENLVALIEAVGDVNVAAEILQQVKKEKL